MNASHRAAARTGLAVIAMLAAGLILVPACRDLETSLEPGDQSTLEAANLPTAWITGEVEFAWKGGKGEMGQQTDVVKHATAEFSAFPPTADRPAKGEFYFRVYNEVYDDVTMTLEWMLHREVAVEVKGAYVDAALMKGWFVGEVISDTKICTGGGGEGDECDCGGGGGHDGGHDGGCSHDDGGCSHDDGTGGDTGGGCTHDDGTGGDTGGCSGSGGTGGTGGDTGGCGGPGGADGDCGSGGSDGTGGTGGDTGGGCTHDDGTGGDTGGCTHDDGTGGDTGGCSGGGGTGGTGGCGGDTGGCGGDTGGTGGCGGDTGGTGGDTGGTGGCGGDTGGCGGDTGGTGGDCGDTGGDCGDTGGGCSGGGHSGGGSASPSGKDRTGQWIAVKVHDRDTPGIEIDGITWRWFTEETVPSIDLIADWPHLCKKEILEGNLMIHIRDD